MNGYMHLVQQLHKTKKSDKANLVDSHCIEPEHQKKPIEKTEAV